jgi:hypothetical protein
MSAGWGEAYFDHYEDYMGECEGREVFPPYRFDGPALQILTYESVFPDATCFCTLGLSHYEAELGGVWEVFTACDAGRSAIPSLLAVALMGLVERGISLERGVRVGGLESANAEFAASFDKSAVYLTNLHGVPDSFETVSLEQQQGGLLQAIFISRSERELLEDVGVTRFEARLEEAGVDPFRIDRVSLTE